MQDSKATKRISNLFIIIIWILYDTYLYFWYIIHLLSWPFPPNDVGQRVTRGLTDDTAFRVVDGESLVEELLDLGPDDDVQVGFSLDTAGSVFGDTSIHAFILSSQLVGNQITRVFIQYPPSTESKGIHLQIRKVSVFRMLHISDAHAKILFLK